MVLPQTAEEPFDWQELYAVELCRTAAAPNFTLLCILFLITSFFLDFD